ncbi:conserved protein of unknown function; putative ATPase domain [Modestobacter italicus]|uniref:ATPase involved in chromosome partitioning n=1 Tax=Modestobacter italicus (strain DSM 44449 / CECT 9708 / BC 501) TaxID=2732864 RepID=I4F0R1_MODI5|nr:hypothetical protein [Modestobacter marinus]CCH89224.1 conserved protein of unknown function; putative ATPase domain [Modestobacter marinus]
MLTVLTSGKAAPGVTTSTWALALNWTRPVLVADCDPAGGDMAPGLLAGRVTTDRGLLSWSTAARRDLKADAAAALLLDHAVQLPEQADVSLVPGFATTAQGASFTTGTWERLALALASSAATIERDVLVDAGRLVHDRGGWPVLRAADRVLLVVRPSVRSVHAAQDAAQRLRQQLGDLFRVSTLVVGRGPYSAKEVADALHLPLAGVLPDDPTTASFLSDGTSAGARTQRRSALLREAATLAAQLAATAESAGEPAAVAG